MILMSMLNTIFVFKGTLLEQPTLYEEDIITPENLQKYAKILICQGCHVFFNNYKVSVFVCVCRTLESEELRKLYISPPVPAENRPLVYPEAGQPWIGRRIDYILYRESSISKHCQTVRASVFTFDTVLQYLAFEV